MMCPDLTKIEDPNPWSRFETPGKLVADESLTHAEKLELLRLWEEDVRRLSVASEEGMTGPSDVLLEDVVSAQKKLGNLVEAHRAPNKG